MSLTLLALVLLAMILSLAQGCSGGGDDGDTVGPFPGPGEGDDGGDDDEPDVIGIPQNPFLPPNGYGDLRGVAATREFVYVADSEILYCFDKKGNLRNAVAALGEIQGVAAFPPVLAKEVDNPAIYLLPNCPVISHDPVGGWGYATIYTAGLDAATTRGDDDNLDARRIDGLPNDGRYSPPSTNGALAVTAVYDIKVDRYGSVYVIIDADIPTTQPIPDYPRNLTVMTAFNDYIVEDGGPLVIEDQTSGVENDIGFPGFHITFGAASGDFDLYNDGNDITPSTWVDLGTLALADLYPDRIANSRFPIFLTAANFLRDYVGEAEIALDPLDPEGPRYSISDSIDNGYGFNRIIGGPPGGAPGSFSPFGSPEDPDTTEGGPMGMAIDPSNNDLYVCDPGNGRVQIFDQDNDYKDVISGFDAPSDVAIDERGNVFVCDVSRLTPIFKTLPDEAFGNVGGTVRNSVIDTPIEGAVVSLIDGDGIVFEQEVTNINGEYIFENLPIGNYFLDASKFNYNSDAPRQAIQILADRTIVANFNLTPLAGNNNGSYVGQIDDVNSGMGLADVTVKILGTSIETISEDGGHFEIANLPAGDYQVEFSKEGYVTLTKDITILRSTTTRDDFIRLERLP